MRQSSALGEPWKQQYSTIPAAAEEQPLSQQAKSNKSILAGVAAVAFVLGVSAATAVTSSTTPKTINFSEYEFDPVCAPARANFEKCVKNEPEVCEENFPGFIGDPFRFDGTRSYDDNKKYQNCGEWYGSLGEHMPENGWVDHSESYACWEKKCDDEIKALAQCTNELMLKNVYGADCTCESNPLPENSKDGWVPPPGVKACKPK